MDRALTAHRQFMVVCLSGVMSAVIGMSVGGGELGHELPAGYMRGHGEQTQLAWEASDYCGQLDWSKQITLTRKSPILNADIIPGEYPGCHRLV